MSITEHVRNSHHETVRKLPVFVPLHASQFFSVTNGDFIYGPLLTDALFLIYHHDALSTSCNPMERNLMGVSREIEWTKPSIHFFLFIILHDLP
jgi:hypothetical protein